MTKAKWVQLADKAVIREAPYVRYGERDGRVADMARALGVPDSALAEPLWANDYRLVSVYGPLGSDLRLRARFVGTDSRWPECPDRFYEVSRPGAESAARDFAEFLAVGPSRLMNAREKMRDAAHYVREMQTLDCQVAEAGSRINGVNGFPILDAYRRHFVNVIDALQGAANQLLATRHTDQYQALFETSPLLTAINGLRNNDVHNILSRTSIAHNIPFGGNEETFVTFDTSYLESLEATLGLDLSWRVPSHVAADALRQLAAIVDRVAKG